MGENYAGDVAEHDRSACNEEAEWNGQVAPFASVRQHGLT